MKQLFNSLNEIPLIISREPRNMEIWQWFSTMVYNIFERDVCWFC